MGSFGMEILIFFPLIWQNVQPKNRGVKMESEFIKLKNNLKIHYVSVGDKANQTLVLLHGWPTNCYLWRNIMPTLAENFYVIAPDLPGYGNSDKPEDVAYNLNFYVDFLKNFYDALGIEQADLVGHDTGGMAALGFVSRFPEMTRRFVITDTSPYVEWSILLKLMLKSMRSRLIARWSLVRFVFKNNLRRHGVYQKQVITDEVVDLYRNPYMQNRNSRRAFRLTLLEPPEEIIEPVESIRRIQNPTLILWAAKDRLFGVNIADQLNEDIPNSKLVIVPDSGHFLQEDQPELVTQHIMNFLTSQTYITY